MSSLAYVRPDPPRGLIRIGGADRVTFLQGLVSNDVRLVSPTAGIWSALLTPQGKYLHDFMIVAEGETLLLETELDRVGDLAQRLKRFKLRSAVTIEELGEAAEIAHGWGEDAARMFHVKHSGEAREVDGAIVLLDPRRAELGVRVIAPGGGAAALLERHGFAPAEWPAWDRHRIKLGVPDGARDLVAEKSILLENGFDELHGVAWDKGCYMGQELTARTKYRGLVKKRLMPVRVASPVPAGTIIERPDGSEAGEMRGSSGDLALALIRLDAIEGALTAAGVPVEVLPRC